MSKVQRGCHPRLVKAKRGIILVAIAVVHLAPSGSRAQYYLPSGHCAGCHPVQAYDWKQSRHSQATNPYFLSKVKEHVTQGGKREDCLACHAPLAVQRDFTWDGYDDLYLEEGVTCDVCHKIADTCLQDGTGHYDLAPGRVRRARLPGARALLHNGQLRHETAYSELHGRSELCMACHERRDANEPLHTFSEWTQSGVTTTCQDCHMVSSPGFASVWSTSPARPHVAEHRFQAEDALLEVRTRATSKGLAVEVVNGTPHALPTGSQTFLRVTALDTAGHVLAEEIRGRHAKHPSLPPGGRLTILVANGARPQCVKVELLYSGLSGFEATLLKEVPL